MLSAHIFVAATLSTLSSVGVNLPAAPLTDISQMVYDAHTDNLYLPCNSQHFVLVLHKATSAPTSGSSTTPWLFQVFSGTATGFPPAVEAPPSKATMYAPMGLLGWPYFGVVGERPMGATALSSSPLQRWVGLFIADHFNHAVVFVNFDRGNNMTLVAGTSTRSAGAIDDVGTAARLNGPFALTWSWLWPLTTTQNTYLVFWTDASGHCVRQGIPVNHVDRSNPTVMTLQKMMLNVTTAVGLCSGAMSGYTGPAWQQAVFNFPTGLAAVNPFMDPAAQPSMFVCDSNNHRVVMISPMWPPDSRMLASIWNDSVLQPQGITIIVRLSTLTKAVVDLLFGTLSTVYINSTLTMTYDSTVATGNTRLSSGISEIMVTSGVTNSRWVVFIPHVGNRSMPVFGGTWGKVLQYYCCFGIELAGGFNPVFLGNGSVSRVPTRSRTWRNRPIRISWTRTWSTVSQTTSLSASHAVVVRRRVNSTHGHQRTHEPSRTPSLPFPQRRRHHRTRTASRAELHRLSGVNVTTAGYDAMLLSVSVTSSTHATAVGAMAASAMVPGAASKAAIAGRTAAVWRCGILGPAQAAADDPQQFLSFGATIGDGPLAGVSAALVLTSGIRLVATVCCVILVKLRPVTKATVRVLIGVSVGYFTPNVVGLSTQTLATTGIDGGTLAAVIFALFAEGVVFTTIITVVLQSKSSTTEEATGRAMNVLRACAEEFIAPFRRTKRHWFRMAGVEDVVSAVAIAVVSNLPLNSSDACQRTAWGLLTLTLLHLLYVVLLRPYRTIIDNAVAIWLALVNAGFALLCCVVSHDDLGAAAVQVGLAIVAGAFYVALVIGVVHAVWRLCQR